LIPVKRNKYVAIAGANLSVNQSLVAKSRLLAGWRGYTTNLDQPDEFIIGAYHRLYQVEKSFRMSKHDLQARPFHVWTRQSIEAHLTIVFAALAVGRWIEAATGWSIKKIKNTLKDYLTIGIQTKSGIHIAQDPLPVEVQAMLNDIYRH
jgi:transposase